MIVSAWFSFPSETSIGFYLLALIVVFSLAYWLFTTALLYRRFRRGEEKGRGDYPSSPNSPDLPPVTFLRPIKRGIPQWEEKIIALLAVARPGDRVLFGVNDSDEHDRCLALCDRFTPEGVGSTVILCPSSAPGSNPKVEKLLAMETAADWGPAYWIITDAEALPTPAMMDAFRAEWHQSAAALLTAGYTFTRARRLPQQLDHLPTLLTLWPGLAAADFGTRRSPHGLGFALGACIGLHRDDLQRIGGLSALRTSLAEDHHLGAALARVGRPARLAHSVISLDSDPLGWLDWLLHQHRMAFTYRVCNPAGTLGMALTFGLPASLAAAMLHPYNPHSPQLWGLFLLLSGTRIALARMVATRVIEQGRLGKPGKSDLPSLPRFALGVLLASLLEPFFWLAAWLPLPVRWGRSWLRVDRHGQVRNPSVSPAASVTSAAPATSTVSLPVPSAPSQE